ncbi:MAG: hypothetical protein KAT43_03355 [Nanoarchaeota archaeon]|nr:hypothetical protein [Nanoarchaeota archaeon]
MQGEREIKLIERVLGHKFGEKPKIILNTWKNLFLEHTYAREYTPWGYFEALIALLAFELPAALYIHQTRTCLIPAYDKSGFRQFAILHELMHSYILQRNPEMNKNKFSVYQMPLLSTWKETMEEWEEKYLRKYIAEGIGDYVAILAQKILVAEGMSLEHAYGVAEEYDLAGYEDVSTEVAPKGLPMNNFFARQLLREASRMLEKLPDPKQHIHDPDLRAKFRRNEFNNYLSIHAHKIGYHIVRSLCESSHHSPGTTIDWLIANPYKSFKEVQEKVPIFQ